MVGREFVPNEDMGEWIDPRRRARRDVARRHERDRVQAARGAEAASKGSRRSSRRSACRRTRLADPHPLPLPGAADRRAQAHAGADHHRDAAAARGASELPAEHQLAHGAGSGEGTGGFAISANILGPDLDQIADYSKKALEPRRRSCRASPRSKIGAQRLEPRNPRRRRSQARRRSRRADGDDWQHAAARGVGRRRDLVLQGRAGAVPGQDPRAREPAAATSSEIGRLTVPVGDRAGADRQHRAARARARPDARCSGPIGSSPSS